MGYRHRASVGKIGWPICSATAKHGQGRNVKCAMRATSRIPIHRIVSKNFIAGIEFHGGLLRLGRASPSADDCANAWHRFNTALPIGHDECLFLMAYTHIRRRRKRNVHYATRALFKRHTNGSLHSKKQSSESTSFMPKVFRRVKWRKFKLKLM